MSNVNKLLILFAWETNPFEQVTSGQALLRTTVAEMQAEIDQLQADKTKLQAGTIKMIFI